MKKSWIAFLTMVFCITLTHSVGAAHKIGFVASITGPASWLGEPQKNTALMLQEWINAAGGIKGVPIEIMIEDSKGMEADAVLATKKLIEKDHVLVVIGSSTTGESMAMVPICEGAETPMISMAAALSIVTQRMKRREWRSQRHLGLKFQRNNATGFLRLLHLTPLQWKRFTFIARLKKLIRWLSSQSALGSGWKAVGN